MKLFTPLCSALLLCIACTSKDPQANAQVLSETQSMSFTLSTDPKTLDPRLATSITASNVISMLYDGLTRTDNDGKVIPAMAEKITLSPDMKSYTFVLRNASWSNGDPVRAQDFAYSWKTQLKPAFKAPKSYMLFVIKGAENAYHTGKTDDLGITVVDDKTLKVDLEAPTPYFLQMAATPSFFPVHQKWVEAHPDFKVNGAPSCLANGAFMLSSYSPGQSIQLVKNDHYWSASSVKLRTTSFSFFDDTQSFTAFEKKNLDWIGNPFNALSESQVLLLQKEQALSSTPSASTGFLRVNTTSAPFSNLKMRKSFATAIDLQMIINKAMDSDEIVAKSFVPPVLGLARKEYFTPHDVDGARSLFQTALTEMGLTRETLPPITLMYIGSERAELIVGVIKESIQDALDIDIKLEKCDADTYYKKLLAKQYCLALGTWLAEYIDPMSFLTLFSNASNPSNCTGWQNAKYTELLKTSCLQMDQEKRFELLSEAEEVLMDEFPIMPLFHITFTYAVNPDLQGYVLSPLGIVQLDTAFKVSPKQEV